MADDPLLTLYLTEYVLWQARKAKHPFIAALSEVVSASGWQVELRLNGLDERLASVARPGWSLFYEDPPLPGKCLTLRRSYLEPFWQIERSARRWDWAVARATFDPDGIDPGRAAQFCGFWRRKLGLPTAAPPAGYIYVPLQGRLTEQRSFQSMSPIRMLETLIEAEPSRRIVAALHPRETYGPEDHAALDALTRHPTFEMSQAGMEALLPGCDYVATQNSSVALKGFFLDKPALLFARIDFHHPAASVPRDGLDRALSRIAEAPSQSYERYLFWFFQVMALNHWRPDFPERLRDRLASHGLHLRA